jgi:hypothetical protein
MEVLSERFPGARRSELARFMAARRGDAGAAGAMYAKALQWRQDTFPIARDADVDAVVASRVFYQLPGLAHDGSSVVVFHGSNHQPARFTTAQTIRGILFVVSAVLAGRDHDDPRLSIILYAPVGTPADLKGLKALATTFSDFFPVRIMRNPS